MLYLLGIGAVVLVAWWAAWWFIATDSTDSRKSRSATSVGADIDVNHYDFEKEERAKQAKELRQAKERQAAEEKYARDSEYF